MAARVCLQAAAALVLASCLPAAIAGSAPGTLATPPPSVVWVKLSGRNCLDTCEAGGLAAVARGRLCAVPNSWPAPEGSDTWLYEGAPSCKGVHSTTTHICKLERTARGWLSLLLAVQSGRVRQAALTPHAATLPAWCVQEPGQARPAGPFMTKMPHPATTVAASLWCEPPPVAPH